ncbi:hypothetical protein [Aquimarina agarivorans]|uniref:hypothetical protein n=1 Tax=Aquimarina agarivorans TaxID=980584 RepID=UPI000248E7D7|nr:hypothetical protein [Aquimarina agarivorans]
MKQFIKHSVVFAMGVFLLVFMGLLLPNNNPVRSVDYSLLKKHELLHENNGSKLILTGGSNVIFGFNSKILQTKLNKPVVNHAIHAGYGLKYIVEDVFQYVKKGDIILLSPEYSHFIDNNYLGKEPLLFSLKVKPNNIRLISLGQLLNVAEFIPKFSFDRIKSFVYNKLKPSKPNKNEIGNYTEFSINEFGDHYTHWDDKNKNLTLYNFNGEVNMKVIEFLNNINEEIEKKGAQLILSFPSICETTYETNKNTILKIEETLIKNCNFKILDTPEDYVFNDSLFFDTSYHLNKIGIKNRSEKIAFKLKNEVK